MKIYKEIDLQDFEAWSGAFDRIQDLNKEQLETIQSFIEANYPYGLTECELNDFIWFDAEDIWPEFFE